MIEHARRLHPRCSFAVASPTDLDLEPGEVTSDVVASGCTPKGAPPPVVPDAIGEPAPPSAPSSPGQSSTEQQTTPTGEAPASQTPAPRFSNSGTTGPARAATPAAAAASVPLVELYENTNFGGRSFIVYGNAGPCDASGYSISDSSTPNSTVGGVSSYKAYSNCLAQNLFNRTQYAGTNTVFNGLNQPLVGAAYDNSVLSMKLTSQNNCTTYSQTGGSVCGAIRDKYNQLGGPGKLGYPTTNEVTNPDGTGKRTAFNPDTTIYFSPPTGANQVQGLIFRKWGALGWETGLLGYPTSDELTNPDGIGKRNTFAKNGSIYWSPQTPASQIGGANLQAWGSQGYERGSIGYPTSDEFTNTRSYTSYGNRRNDFERGVVVGNGSSATVGAWYSTPASTSNFSNSRASIPFDTRLLPTQATAGEVPCPGDSNTYRGAQSAFRCLSVQTATDGGQALIRRGRADPRPDPTPGPAYAGVNETEAGAFGAQHAAADHNLYYRAVALLARGPSELREPAKQRYYYTLVLRFGGPQGTAVTSVREVVQRAPDSSNPLQAPDGHPFGLITAFCKDTVTNDPTMPGVGFEGGFCPDDLAGPFGADTGGELPTDPPIFGDY